MNQENIWEYFQNEFPESFEASKPRLKYIMERINHAGDVLNIGIGAGIMEMMCIEKNINIHSLDPDEASIDRIRKQLNIQAKHGYASNIPWEDNSFDAVILSEVLEHLDSDTAILTLNEVQRVLRPGGIFLGTVPAREDLIKNICVCPGCGLKYHRWGHQQSFTISSLSTLLFKYFSTVKVYEKYFVYWKRLNWKGILESIIKNILKLLGFNISSANLFFIAKKIHN
jgi:ubiquinone/menaquinone biosynthesis C-methylase UbiE